MPEISAEEVIKRVRQRMAVEPMAPAYAWRVRRIDKPDKAYYLIVFGHANATIAVAAVDCANGALMASATLPGTGAHLTVDADQAREKTGYITSAPAELVWKPCSLSRSPLYPFWQVGSGDKVVYVDQQGGVWSEVESAGPGG